jgi:hypothetical protein
MCASPRTYIVDCIGCLVGGHFPKTEAYKRHVVARSQLDGRDGHCWQEVVDAR